MTLYLSVSTDLKGFVIAYIEVGLATGETVSLDWKESETRWLDNGFQTRYKDICFDGENANGKIDRIRGMQLDGIGIYAEAGNDSKIVITEMSFEDVGERYDLERFLPYTTSLRG